MLYGNFVLTKISSDGVVTNVELAFSAVDVLYLLAVCFVLELSLTIMLPLCSSSTVSASLLSLPVDAG